MFDNMDLPPSHSMSEVGAFRLGSWELTLRRQNLEKATLARHYDQLATNWTAKTDRLGLRRAYDALMTPISPLSNKSRLSALDVGIGTGEMSLALARRMSNKLDITGIDLSSRMLKEAEKRLKAQGLHPQLRKADVCHLPYHDDSFDMVICGHIIEHLCDPAIALQEMHRVLRPGGRVLICMTRDSWAGMCIQLMWRTHCVSEKRASSWLTDAGFRDTQVLKLPNRTAMKHFSLGYVAQKPNRY